MPSNAHEFLGLEAYSRDGERIGKVEDVIREPGSEMVQCLVIKYGAFRDLVVPVDAVLENDGSVTVSVTLSFLDAPPAGSESALSRRQRDRLDRSLRPNLP